jgi:hypothetical protein
MAQAAGTIRPANASPTSKELFLSSRWKLPVGTPYSEALVGEDTSRNLSPT